MQNRPHGTRRGGDDPGLVGDHSAGKPIDGTRVTLGFWPRETELAELDDNGPFHLNMNSQKTEDEPLY